MQIRTCKPNATGRTQLRGHGFVRGSTSLYCLRFALCLLLVGTGGCLLIPTPASDPEVVAGKRVEDTSITFIKPGTTTRAEVIQKLGEPTLNMPELRLMAYEWEQRDYHLFWVLVGSNTVAGGKIDPYLLYDMFVSFDRADRVSAFGLEKRGILGGLAPIQEAARNWAEHQGLTVPPLAARFVVRDVPPGQTVLYIYRPSGFFSPDRAFGQPPKVLFDRRLEAEIKRGTYVALTPSPGEHSVTVVPEGVPHGPGTDISLKLAPDMKYFILVTLPGTFTVDGTLFVELTLQSEQEAMPVLGEMRPAR